MRSRSARGYGPSKNVLTQKRRRPGQSELKVVSLSHRPFRRAGTKLVDSYRSITSRFFYLSPFLPSVYSSCIQLREIEILIPRSVYGASLSTFAKLLQSAYTAIYRRDPHLFCELSSMNGCNRTCVSRDLAGSLYGDLPAP